MCFKSWIAEEYLLDYQNLLENFWKSRITDNQDQHKSIKEINEVKVFPIMLLFKIYILCLLFDTTN